MGLTVLRSNVGSKLTVASDSVFFKIGWFVDWLSQHKPPDFLFQAMLRGC